MRDDGTPLAAIGFNSSHTDLVKDEPLILAEATGAIDRVIDGYTLEGLAECVKSYRSKPTMPPDVKREAGLKKPQLVLMPPIAEELTCKVMAFGADRYGPWNWRASGVEVSTYISAIKRHLAAIHRGEWLDPESGLPHMAHVAASACIVLDADEHGCLNKDVTQTKPL